MNAYETEHISRLLSIAPECMVLLKKDGKFPLTSTCEIGLYGNGIRHTVKGGTGSGDVNVRHYSNIEEAFEKAGFTINSKHWLDAYENFYNREKQIFAKEIKRKIRKKGLSGILLALGCIMPEPEYSIAIEPKNDTAIYVLSRVSGEGADRKNIKGDFRLTDTEIRDILLLNEKCEKFMLVLNVGGVIDLSPVAEKVKNILLISQTGMTTGDSLAEVILGHKYPSGKLTSTWAKYDDYCHAGDFGNKDDTRYKEGIYVGYRYFSTFDKKPLFPFGFGLSYTDFETRFNSVNTSGSVISIEVTVKNIGNFRGKEVVQVYISKPGVQSDSPKYELVSYLKSNELNPGEAQKLLLKFDICDFASFDEKTADSVLEAGLYPVYLGNCVECINRVCTLGLKQNVTVRSHMHIGGKADFIDLKSEKLPESDTENVIFLDIDKFEFAHMSKDDITPKYTAFAESLSCEEMAFLAVGAFNDGGSKSVIGSASLSVCGAAGETTKKLNDKGIPSLVMADGPAGIRISRKYGVDEKGMYPIDKGSIGEMAWLMPFPINLILSRDTSKNRKGKIYEQYCSAIPVGTAIGQSFSPEVAEMCGDIVGEEMELFGIDLWLAPALNIHRNPLCGRNFEYYSEDPLLSGNTAGAVTRGVQKHKGKGVVQKHFAANNQETNRFRSNSIVSERAFREIYLKGFEISVKENPAAIMTSYNLLNGRHTSEREDLLVTLLRDEWGYQGVIMTDWVVATKNGNKGHKYPQSTSVGCISAGNNLIMPGGKKDYEALMESLKSGSVITRDRLVKNTAIILRMIDRLKPFDIK